jgi:hypothetical protein
MLLAGRRGTAWVRAARQLASDMELTLGAHTIGDGQIEDARWVSGMRPMAWARMAPSSSGPTDYVAWRSPSLPRGAHRNAARGLIGNPGSALSHLYASRALVTGNVIVTAELCRDVTARMHWGRPLILLHRGGSPMPPTRRSHPRPTRRRPPEAWPTAEDCTRPLPWSSRANASMVSFHRGIRAHLRARQAALACSHRRMRPLAAVLATCALRPP